MTSESLNELAAALAKAQAEMKNASLNKINPHFRSKYADLAAIVDAAKEPLSKHGLSIVQTMQLSEMGFVLVTRLLHSSGQSITSEYPLPMQVDQPQKMGSAITYARRYCMAAIVGMAADEDDDANAAQDKEADKQSKATADNLIAQVNEMTSVADIEAMARDADYKRLYASLSTKDKARVATAGQNKKVALGVKVTPEAA